MGFLDILKAKSRDKDLIHIKNMILVATADSVLQNAEMTLLTHIMVRMNISEDYVERALDELVKENKIIISGGRVIHTYNAHAHIDVVPVEDLAQKLKYLQDYVIIMMSDGSIDDREKRFIEAICVKMGLPAYFVDIAIKNVAQQTKGYGTAPAEASSSDSTRTEVSAKAKRFYRFVKQQATYIADNFQSLTPEGLGEAKILCSAIFSRLCSDLDEDTGEDYLICLLDDIEQFNTGNGEEQLDFLSSRMDFYGEELNQFRQPTHSCMAIYNTLYVHPFTDEPYDLEDIDADPMTLMMLRQTIIDVSNIINQKVGNQTV